jgi:Uncharacterized protein conserved in bacteria
MIDPKAILDQFLGAKVPGTESTVGDKARQAGQLARENPIATGLIAAVLLGTPAGRAVAGSALRLGGLAAVAGLGYQAWKNYQSGQTPGAATAQGESAARPPELPAPPANSGFSGDSARTSDDHALALVRVMIAAAKADGHVDDAERARIHDKLELTGMAADAVAFLDRELAAEIDIDALAARAVTEAQKVEMYTAARLTIEPDMPAEREFLSRLASRLGLEPGLVGHIEATVAAAKV